jgi:hypothetical protein
MSQYDPLYKWLRASSGRRIATTFEKIESILAFKLPYTARARPQWWANEQGNSRHVQCRAWLDAGFHTENLNLAKQTVDFVLGLSKT